ncbi:ATP-binding cassette domain-containing protein [Limosilactobacillus gastricus]|uniref:ABC-type quaternary amine transporter n=1 Tax=Limosilactobacillus gastricus DSM 16045 TaxID=1423749 RepID=A0A0R1VHF6_9LACO|nr:ABC transporter ATP-binding protein [Limosilactobacillus gastricus]KRM02649.1 Glycine betaine ABC transporter ATP-binding component [Limosilactobacillus gastricus DSM 16045]QGF40407.1 ATP-binding cassette domain-containing protein [Limosilactobacillus gastricus]
MTKEVIKFDHVSKSFGDHQVIKDLSFTINAGEFITILGTSGCGKTTTLKMINGLLTASSGQVLVNGLDPQTTDLVALRRQIGYVVQQVGLFPHMTIADNLSITPKLMGWNQEQIKQRNLELLKLVDMDNGDYLNRYPRELSGGQQQRIGVARALAANPPIVLFDEPLGALDALTRLNLQEDLKKLHQQLNDHTFVLVTHDINEAFFLGQRVMIMDQGHIEQFADPQTIIDQPATPFVKALLQTEIDHQRIWRERHD